MYTYFKEQFNINSFDIDVNLCKQHVRTVERQSIVICLHTQISVKCSQFRIPALAFRFLVLTYLVNCLNLWYAIMQHHLTKQ